MALLVIVGIMTGAIIALIMAKVTRWYELLLLGGWGILGTVCVYNGYWADFISMVRNWAGMG